MSSEDESVHLSILHSPFPLFLSLGLAPCDYSISTISAWSKSVLSLLSSLVTSLSTLSRLSLLSISKCCQFSTLPGPFLLFFLHLYLDLQQLFVRPIKSYCCVLVSATNREPQGWRERERERVVLPSLPTFHPPSNPLKALTRLAPPACLCLLVYPLVATAADWRDRGS